MVKNNEKELNICETLFSAVFKTDPRSSLNRSNLMGPLRTLITRKGNFIVSNIKKCKIFL